MKIHTLLVRAIFLVPLLLPLASQADWLRDETTLGWRSGTNVVWRFSYDAKKGKPFFHPLCVADGPSLTNFKPDDHPWHYGLWFSWKYIGRPGSTNHVNYWEEDRTTGQAQGKTVWKSPAIATKPDGTALIRLELAYVTPSGHTDMIEQREMAVSAPRDDGAYTITWRGHFMVGDEALVLDRTPMPGEAGGQVNGGYGGLALRMAGLPLTVSMLSTTGLVTKFETDRARPFAAAMAFDFLDGEKLAGAVAILTDPRKGGETAPWYLVNSTTFRFACAAILAPQPITVAAHQKMDLTYQICVQPKAWTVETLQAEEKRWASQMR